MSRYRGSFLLSTNMALRSHVKSDYNLNNFFREQECLLVYHHPSSPKPIIPRKQRRVCGMPKPTCLTVDFHKDAVRHHTIAARSSLMPAPSAISAVLTLGTIFCPFSPLSPATADGRDTWGKFCDLARPAMLRGHICCVEKRERLRPLVRHRRSSAASFKCARKVSNSGVSGASVEEGLRFGSR